MSKILPNHVVEALKEFAATSGLENAKFNFFEGSDKGFVGLIKRCEIRSDDRKLSVICKFLPDNKEQNETFHSYELFRREVFVYEKVLPLFKGIQLENGLKYRGADGFWSFPECYACKFDEKNPEKSFILMEDLSRENFVTCDSSEPRSFNFTRRLFTELGKFHGISFALRAKSPETYREFMSLDDLMCRMMTTENMKGLAPRNCQLASELFNLPEEKLQREKILECKNDLWVQIENLLKPKEAEPYGVMCHGDCWTNNIMINFDDGKEIKNLRLIDWQQTRFGSGASELMYFLFACTDKNTRDRHKELFDIYYNALREVLKNFKIDANEVYPEQEFQHQLRKFGKFAFAMASFAKPFDFKYPEKLFENKTAELTEAERNSVIQYGIAMKDIVNDLIAMKAF